MRRSELYASFFPIVAAVLAAALFATPANATSFTSVKSGDWNTAATWGTTTAPGNGDTVEITAGKTVTAVAAMHASTVTIDAGAELDPSNGSSIGDVSNAGTVIPAAGATVNVTNWSNTGTFTPNGSTIVFGLGSNPYSITTNQTFAKLTIANSASVTMSANLTVTGTLTLNGNLTLSNDGTSTNQFKDLVAGASSMLDLGSGTTSLTGNFTTASASAPFGAASSSASGTLTFNGIASQTIAGNPFIPNVVIGSGSATVVSGAVRTLSIVVNSPALFEPGDGTETGSITGPVTPVANATITVATSWNNVTFTPNNSTVVFGPTSWGLVPTSGQLVYTTVPPSIPLPIASSTGSVTFANVTIAQGFSVSADGSLTSGNQFNIVGVGFNSTGTLTLNGSLSLGAGPSNAPVNNQWNNVTCGSASSLHIPSYFASFLGNSSGATLVKGNFSTSSSEAPFGLPPWNLPGTLTFNGAALQTISGTPWIPLLAIGTGGATVVTGTVRTGSITVDSHALFEPGDGTETGDISGPITPVLNATITVATGWHNDVVFTPNDSTVVFGPTSWGLSLSSSAGPLTIVPSSSITFANLTIADNYAVHVFSFPIKVTGLLTLNGTLELPTPSQLNNVTCGIASSLIADSPFEGNTLVSGNFTTVSSTAPFGDPNRGQLVTFNGTGLQTITGILSVGAIAVGTGGGTIVAGTVKANNITVDSHALFEPGDGTETGNISGPVTPAPNARITVGGDWSGVTFTANNSTVVFGPTSWGYGLPPSNSHVITGSSVVTFANVMIADNFTVSSNVATNSTGTLTLNGSITLPFNVTNQFNNVICGSASSFGIPLYFSNLNTGGMTAISGNFTTSSNTAPFGAPVQFGSIGMLTFNGTAPQTITGNPFIPRIAVGTGGATVVTGAVKTNSVTVDPQALFEPGDGTEVGLLSGPVTPVGNARMTVASGWNNVTFTPNNSTVVFGALSWSDPGFTSLVTIDTATVFDNVVITPVAQLTIAAPVTTRKSIVVDGTTQCGNYAPRCVLIASGNIAPIAMSGAGTLHVSVLKVDNQQGVTSSIAPTIDDALNLAQGVLTLTGPALTLPNAVNRTAGWINGQVHRVLATFLVTGSLPETLPLGGALVFTPVTYNFSGAQPDTIDVRVNDGVYPSASLGSSALKRWWMFSETSSSAGSLPNADLTLTYAPSDVVHSESNLRLASNVGGIWSFIGTTAPDTTNHQIVLTSVPVSSGIYGLGEPAVGLGFTSINNGVNPRVTIPFAIAVNAVDTDGGTAVVSSPTGVTVTAATPGALIGTNTATIGAGGTGVVFGNMTYTVAAPNVLFTAARTSGDAIANGTTNVTILDAPATHFTVVAPANTTSGAAMTVAVTALGANNLTDRTYRGTVHVVSSDGLFVPFDYAFTAADAGIHTFTITLQSGGSQTITFTDSVLPSIAGTATVNVAKANSTTALASAANPAPFGQMVPFTVTVAPVAPQTRAPSGSVSIHEGATVLGTATLSSGHATLTFSLPLGTHNLTASYDGPDAAFNTSASSALAQVVIMANTTSRVTSSGSPTKAGQPVVFTATVSPVSPAGGTPTGSVRFLDGTTTLATQTLLADGTASLAKSDLTPGTHSITVSYAGDSNYNTSTSAAIIQNVQKATGAIALTSSALPSSAYGQPVTFTAVVGAQPPGSAVGTGSVTFFDGAVSLGTSNLDAAGSALFTTSTLAVGAHPITASFGGDANLTPVTSASLLQAVGAAPTVTTLVSSPNPSTYGASVTFTASVASINSTLVPAGNITFNDGTTVLATVPLTGGSATYTTSTLVQGTHPILATYGATPNFQSSSATLIHNVGQVNSGVTIAASSASSAYSEPVTFTATVTANGTPTGTLTFSDGATVLAIFNVGPSTIAYTTSALAAGSHQIVATYSGDRNFSNGSQSVTHVVTPASTTTSLSSVSPTSHVGQTVVFTASVVPVAPSTAIPTGTVAFFKGGTQAGTVAVDGAGLASIAIAGLAPGTTTITAAYSGASNFAASSSTDLLQSVIALDTTTTMTSSASPSVYGQSVFFSAHVAATIPGLGVPTGSVTFNSDGVAIGTGALDAAGQATLTTSALSVGAHTISAGYAGVPLVFNASSSAALPQIVDKAASTVSLTSSPNPSAFGQTATLTATVLAGPPGAGVPTGTVEFFNGATSLGSAPLDGASRATLTLPSLDAGTYSLSAVFNGDGNFNGGASNVYSHTVSAASSTVVLTSSNSPSIFTHEVTFTASVSATAITPQGTITFNDGNTILGTVTLNGGTASFATSSLAVGSHSITAVYQGSSSMQTSTSPTLTQVVAASGADIAVQTSGTPVMFGSSITFTATVSAPGTPTGTITFRDGATTLDSRALTGGSASITLSSLAVGTHVIYADYSGDVSYSAVTGSVQQVIIQRDTTTSLVASTPQSPFGQSVTFTANVNAACVGGSPTGTVTFSDGGQQLATVALTNGSASFSTSALIVGGHSITAQYSGDATYASSSSSATDHPVSLAATAASLATSTTATSFGQTVTFTATLTSDGGVPSGIVTFLDAGTPIGQSALINGVATFSTSALAIGGHTIHAAYAGDGSFAPASSGSVNVTIAQTATTTNVATSASVTKYGHMLTFSATVLSATSGTPTGTVTFSDGATMLNTVTLAGGTASFSTDGLTAGAHTINVAYNGDAQFQASSGSVAQQIDRASTDLTFAVNPNPAVFGATTTLTATITSDGGVATGNISFIDGGAVIGTASIVNGIASFNTHTLAVGAHPLSAAYAGNASVGQSASNTVVLSVTTAATTTTLTSSASDASVGLPVTFTATVTSSGGTPTGSIAFDDGGSSLATVTLANGVATFTTSSLAIGSHTIHATYTPDSSFAPSSASLTQTIHVAAPTITVSSSPNPSSYLQQVTLSVTVAASNGTPTGSVTFRDGNTTLGNAQLTNGQASVTTSSLATGAHSIVVDYSGDANVSAGTSAAYTHTVNRAATQTSVSSSNASSNFGQPVLFSATVTAPGGGNPTGSVTFYDGAIALGTGQLSGGSASFTAIGLSLGSHLITAVYSGDPSFNTSTSPQLTQSITGIPTSVVLSSSTNPSSFGQSVTFTASVSALSGVPVGSVTFRDGGAAVATVPLNNGVAAFTATQTTGSHVMTAEYGAVGSFLASVSPSLTQTVNPAATTTTLQSSANPAIIGQAVIFTANVTSATGLTPVGSVAFKDGVTLLGSTPLSSGSASVSTSTLGAGSHTITAVFSGSGDFVGSSSSSVTEVVKQPLMTSISPTSRCQANGPFTLAVNGSGFANGLVIRWNGSARTTTVNGDTQMAATISAADVSAPGTYSVSVVTPTGAVVPTPATFSVIADTVMPVVTPPAPVVVIATVSIGNQKGATGATSPQLAAFLAGGSASDNCSSTFALSPQVNGVNVDNSTLFKPGKTTVTFRFSDGAGNIATATATAQVIAAGDANLDGNVDVTDLVIVANYLAGNIPGDSDLVRNAATMDLNGDGKVDAVDMVILANYLAGNISSLGQ